MGLSCPKCFTLNWYRINLTLVYVTLGLAIFDLVTDWWIFKEYCLHGGGEIAIALAIICFTSTILFTLEVKVSMMGIKLYARALRCCAGDDDVQEEDEYSLKDYDEDDPEELDKFEMDDFTHFHSRKQSRKTRPSNATLSSRIPLEELAFQAMDEEEEDPKESNLLWNKYNSDDSHLLTDSASVGKDDINSKEYCDDGQQGREESINGSVSSGEKTPGLIRSEDIHNCEDSTDEAKEDSYDNDHASRDSKESDLSNEEINDQHSAFKQESKTCDNLDSTQACEKIEKKHIEQKTPEESNGNLSENLHLDEKKASELADSAPKMKHLPSGKNTAYQEHTSKPEDTLLPTFGSGPLKCPDPKVGEDQAKSKEIGLHVVEDPDEEARNERKVKKLRYQRWDETVTFLLLVLEDVPTVCVLVYTFQEGNCQIFSRLFRDTTAAYLALFSAFLSALWKFLMSFRYLIGCSFYDVKDCDKRTACCLLRVLRPAVAVSLCSLIGYIVRQIRDVREAGEDMGGEELCRYIGDILRS